MTRGTLHIMGFLPLLCAAPLSATASGELTVIDNAGNAWFAGTGNFIVATPNAFEKTETDQDCGTQNLSPFQPPTSLPCTHAYLTEHDSSGNLLYATYLGGRSQDGAVALTTDTQGNVYIAGYTYSPDFPVTPGVVQTRNAGPTTPVTYTELGAPFGPGYVLPGGDIFIAKFTSGGTLVFSTLLGGSGADIPTLIAVDQAGSVYVSGVTQSTDFPLTANAMSSQPAGNFFVKLNPTGSALLYSTYSASPILAFDIDNQGRADLTGYLGAGHDNGAPYVTILDTLAGTMVLSSVLTNLRPTLAGAGVAIAVDSAQNVMLAVSPAPLPYTFYLYPSQQARSLGPSYLFMLSSGLSAILSETDLSQTQFDSIRFDSSGNAYAFGHGTGAIPRTPVQLLAAPCSAGAASFMVETNSIGAVIVATYLRQGTSAAVTITAPGHILLYHAASSTTVPLDLTVQPAALFGCPANLASEVANQGIAPGELFMLTGTGLGPAQGIGAAPNAVGLYPTSLGGVQVFFGSTAVPLLYVQANEIHAVAPFGLPDLPTITVQYGNQTIAPLDAPTSSVNPGIFRLNGQGAIVNQDGMVNTPANPAPLGSIVSVYCTGTGYLETPVTDGSLAPIPPPYITTELQNLQVLFAGVAGITLYSGVAPGLIEGVTQVNVQLPATLPSGTNLSAVPMALEAVGPFSPRVPISVKQR